MEADRLCPRRLPEHVVLEDPHPAIAHQLRGEPARSCRQHLRGDHVVGLPGVAELACAVLRIPAGHPVHLVGSDAGLVLAFEQALVSLSQALERRLGDEALLDDEESVVAKSLYLLWRERLDQERGRVFSGS